MKEIKNELFPLEASPDWMRNHPSFSPWKTGKDQARQRLRNWHNAYSPDVYDRPISSEDDDAIQRRLLFCWLHHWKSAGTPGNPDEIVRSIQKGLGFKKKKNLGGNPLFDLVHAVAVYERQDKGTELFRNRYDALLRSVAAKIDVDYSSAADDSPLWLDELYESLFYGKPKKNGEVSKPVLEAYRGRCGLKNYLPTVVRHFLGRQLKEKQKRGKTRYFDDDFDLTVDRLVIRDDEFQRLSERCTIALQQAKASLTSRQQNHIALYYIDKLKNLEIAALYQETETDASRIRTGAIRLLNERFLKFVEEDPEISYEASELFALLKNDLQTSLAEIFPSNRKGANHA